MPWGSGPPISALWYHKYYGKPFSQKWNAPSLECAHRCRDNCNGFQAQSP